MMFHYYHILAKKCLMQELLIILTINTEFLYPGCQPVMTVSTLFQVKRLETSSNSNKREYDLQNVDIIDKLDCQTVKAYYKATKCVELSDNFPIKNQLYLCKSEPKKHKNKEFITNVIKSNLIRINMDVSTWPTVRSLRNEMTLSLMQVGFLPFILAPVTDNAIVYIAMKHFLNVVSQLKQQTLYTIL